MNAIDVILILAILIGVFFAVRAVRRSRKGGGCGCGCSGNCASCGIPEEKRKP